MNNSENQIKSSSSGNPLNLSTVPVFENIGWKNGISKKINFPVFVVCPDDNDSSKMCSYKAQFSNLLVNGKISVNFENNKLFEYSNELVFFNEEVADLKCNDLNGITAEHTFEELIEVERTLTKSFGNSGHGILEAEFIESGMESVIKKKKKKHKKKRKHRRHKHRIHSHKKSRKRKRKEREDYDSEEEERTSKKQKTGRKTSRKVRKRKIIELPSEAHSIESPELKRWTGVGSVRTETGSLIGTSPEYTHSICRELFPNQIRFTSGMVRQEIEGLKSNGNWPKLLGQYFGPNSSNSLLNNTQFDRVLRRELKPGKTNRFNYYLEDNITVIN